MEVIKCDVCGAIKTDGERWFAVSICFPYEDAILIASPPVRIVDVCSKVCIDKLLHEGLRPYSG